MVADCAKIRSPVLPVGMREGIPVKASRESPSVRSASGVLLGESADGIDRRLVLLDLRIGERSRARVLLRGSLALRAVDVAEVALHQLAGVRGVVRSAAVQVGHED